MDLTEIVFDTPAPLEVPVKLGDKRYVLREPTEDAHIAYRQAVILASKPDGDGRPTQMDGVPATNARLVASCLFEEGKDKHVDQAFVKGLPHRVVDKLFERCKQLADLVERKVEGGGAKNSPDAETATSE